MRSWLTLLLILVPTTLSAQVEIKVEKRLRLEAQGDANVWIWTAPLPLVTEQQGPLLFVEGPAGQYRISVTGLTIDWENKVFTQENGFVDITLGPPEPGPGPDPGPGPGPSPNPEVPFPAPGLSVLIVAEAGEIGNLPAGQRAIFSDGELRSWLNSSTDGRSRIWDDDLTDLGSAPKVMQDAYAAAKKDMSGPWVVISNGKAGVSQALPGTVDELKALVERFK